MVPRSWATTGREANPVLDPKSLPSSPEESGLPGLRTHPRVNMVNKVRVSSQEGSAESVPRSAFLADLQGNCDLGHRVGAASGPFNYAGQNR